MTEFPTIRLPAGRWAVAVSGGADSIALLRIACANLAIAPHVVHLNHETRGAESDADADFVRHLAGDLNLPVTISRRSEIEQSLLPTDHATLPANASARYRALRLMLYRRVAAEHNLLGVLLAHHADDQAETVMLRLIRGAGYPSLAGMAADSVVAGVRLVRPLLNTTRRQLREYLQSIRQPWREDASNRSDDYARNRVRKAISDRPTLRDQLLEVARTCTRLSNWTTRNAPRLADRFPVRQLAELPDVLAAESVVDWLVKQGVPAGTLSPAHVETVLAMCRDAATPAVQTFPAGVQIRRRQGEISRRS